ncbi:7850_t:CDS:2 [Diversispora eburnea]|uniref:7850_t:CDS:1 n=1 Tax=Diversispora eburnea TaxID=1213867 RepID=A0A9N9A1V4_9GLOM|nr:7850_t:CDS:2 [Diversispora eburnea]
MRQPAAIRYFLQKQIPFEERILVTDTESGFKTTGDYWFPLPVINDGKEIGSEKSHHLAEEDHPDFDMTIPSDKNLCFARL